MAVFVTRPHLPHVERLHRLIDEIYATGQLTNNGPILQRLTQQLETYLGIRNLLLVSSGTMALQLALKLLQARGEVVTTPFSFPATTSTILWEGCKPVFADIDPRTWNIDPQGVRDALTKESSLILATHVFGNPCRVDELETISTEAGVPLLFDAAHAFGVCREGDKSVLSHGEMSVLSFHATKLFHSIEGGALIIKDDHLFEQAKTLINFGIQGKGEISAVGINGKLNEVQAAMGLLVLEDIDGIRDGYRRVYQKYDHYLDKRLIRQRVEAADYNYSYFPVIFESESQLLGCLSALEQQEIFPRRYFYPSLDRVAAYGKPADCTVSHSIAERVLCLPIYAELSEPDQDQICDVINRFLAKG